jgi:hypothetical protein
MPRPTGPQFTDVYHFSNSKVPPHLVGQISAHIRNTKDLANAPLLAGTTDSPTFHAGTFQAAADRGDQKAIMGRGYYHKYRIANHPSVMHPVTYGDPEYNDSEVGESKFSRNAAHNDRYPTQQQLWETTPVPEKNDKQVMPYTNAVEDAGSTSYVIPHDLVAHNDTAAAVQYRGSAKTTPLKPTPNKFRRFNR